MWETTQKRKMSTVGELFGGLKKLSLWEERKLKAWMDGIYFARRHGA
jgi:hypothetical protein